jgi:galactoside O-acetyltransferase
MGELCDGERKKAIDLEGGGMTSFYTEDELKTLGLKQYGTNVLISRRCSLYSAEKMSFGSNVRIDDFCILSGNIIIGNYVHIAAWTGMFAGARRITMEDFTGLGAHTAIYAESDDFSGESFTNPMVPAIARKVRGGDVTVKRYATIGAHCVVLPGVTISEGVAVATMGVVIKDLSAEWTTCIGNPCRTFRPRSKNMLELEHLFNY